MTTQALSLTLHNICAYMDPAQCDEVILVLSIKEFFFIESRTRVSLALLRGYYVVCHSRSLLACEHRCVRWGCVHCVRSAWSDSEGLTQAGGEGVEVWWLITQVAPCQGTCYQHEQCSRAQTSSGKLIMHHSNKCLNIPTGGCTCTTRTTQWGVPSDSRVLCLLEHPKH